MPTLLDISPIQTDRLILRVPCAEDTGAMLAFLGSDRAEFYGGPMNANDAWYKFAAYTGQWILRGYGFYSMILKDTGEMAGMAGPHQPAHFPEPEMSWLLTEARFEGSGLAAEACQAVLTHLFADLGWTSVVSYIDKNNLASKRLAERLGAQPDASSKSPIPNCDAFRHMPMGASV